MTRHRIARGKAMEKILRKQPDGFSGQGGGPSGARGR